MMEIEEMRFMKSRLIDGLLIIWDVVVVIVVFLVGGGHERWLCVRLN